jgi:hypothetical protein
MVRTACLRKEQFDPDMKAAGIPVLACEVVSLVTNHAFENAALRKKHIEEMAGLNARHEQEHAEAEWRQAATLAGLLDRLEQAGSGIR